MRILCLRCLRLWPSERYADRASCPHCGGESFDRGELPFVNRSIFDDDIAVFCCRACGRFELFREARVTRPDVRGKAADCTRCGTLIPATVRDCPNCGESK